MLNSFCSLEKKGHIYIGRHLGKVRDHLTWNEIDVQSLMNFVYCLCGCLGFTEIRNLDQNQHVFLSEIEFLCLFFSKPCFKRKYKMQI